MLGEMKIHDKDVGAKIFNTTAFRCHQDSVTSSNFLSLTNLVLVPSYSALGKPPLDTAIHGKAEELDMLLRKPASLKAKSPQVDELAREIETIRSNANSSIKSVLEELKRNDEIVLKLNAQLNRETDGVARASYIMKEGQSSSEQKLAARRAVRGDVVSAKEGWGAEEDTLSRLP